MWVSRHSFYLNQYLSPAINYQKMLYIKRSIDNQMAPPTIRMITARVKRATHPPVCSASIPLNSFSRHFSYSHTLSFPMSSSSTPPTMKRIPIDPTAMVPQIASAIAPKNIKIIGIRRTAGKGEGRGESVCPQSAWFRTPGS